MQYYSYSQLGLVVISQGGEHSRHACDLLNGLGGRLNPPLTRTKFNQLEIQKTETVARTPLQLGRARKYARNFHKLLEKRRKISEQVRVGVGVFTRCVCVMSFCQPNKREISSEFV